MAQQIRKFPENLLIFQKLNCCLTNSMSVFANMIVNQTIFYDYSSRLINSFCNKYFILRNMCYLKNLAQQDNVDLDDFMKKGEETHQEQSQMEANVLIPCLHKHVKPIWSDEQQMLVTLFGMIQKNNYLIRSMNKSLNGCSQYIEKGSIQTEKSLKNHDIQIRETSRQDQSLCLQSQENTSLVQKLFGCHKYKYSLQLSSQFPNVIYKQRNFNLELKVVDSEGKIVRNCNILNLCCAVASCDAEWIHENRVGQPFLKGKTQVQLYKGQASFVKLYARQVSRVYPQGKINLVIYSKPSTILYSGTSSYQILINSEQIRPLIIQDIVIKAKKKE